MIARAACTSHMAPLGVAIAVAMALLALATWRHGDRLYHDRGRRGMRHLPQATPLRLLTGATLLTAALAITVSTAV